MEWIFWIGLFLYALSCIGNHFQRQQVRKGLIDARKDLDARKIELEERKIAAIEERNAKKELRKQIKLIENLLPLKQFDRTTLKKMPKEVRQAICAEMGLDPDVVEAYLRMNDEQIERIKVGL